MEVNKSINKQISYECEHCGKHFSQRSSRNRHIREKHLQPGSYECKNCGIRFSKKYNLQMHQKHAHLKDVKKDVTAFKCSFCNCIFTKNSVLKKHITDYHEKKRLQQVASTNQENSNDPQTIAANVIQELKQLQNDILPKNQVSQIISSSSNKTLEQIAIESAIVEEITIKDKLYPLGHFTWHNVQIIKRTDGFSYYICKFCSKEFKKSYDYLRHHRIHTNVRPFICVFCKKSFPTVAQLKTHCNTHKLNEKYGIFERFYKCPKCSEGFTSINQLDTHLRTHLQTNISFECPECLKSFQTLKSLCQHKHFKEDQELASLKSLMPAPISLVEENKPEATNLNENQQTFFCSLCNFQLSSKVTLKQHERRHGNLCKYQCNICKSCKSSFVSQSSLNVHKKIHQKVKKIKCQNCSKNFHNNYQLKRHQLTHSKTDNYKCQYCDKTFKTSQNCRSHMMTHLKQLIKTNEETRKQIEIYKNYHTIIQDLNNQDLITTNTLLKIRSAKKSLSKKDNEQNNLKYKCLRCNKSFLYAAWLRKHFNYKHTNEKPYKCEICLKSYRTKQVLQNHNLTHSETKPKIFCQVCGKQYASEKSLKLHLRIHTDEKPFECVICNRKFRTSGHLIQHRKSNHSEL